MVFDYLMVGDLSGYSVRVYEFYLTASTLIGIGAVGATLQYVVSENDKWKWGLLAIFLLIALSLSLGRGALVFSLLSIAFFSSYVTLKNLLESTSLKLRLQTIYKFFCVLFLIFICLYIALHVERTRNRLIRPFTGNELEEGGRGLLWQEAWSNISGAPFFGHGLGSSGLLSAGFEQGYPHNLFLQVWLDGGIIGVLLLTVSVGFPIALSVRRGFRGKIARDKSWIPFVGIYLFIIGEYSKSANFYTARSLFIFGICAAWILSHYSSADKRYILR